MTEQSNDPGPGEMKWVPEGAYIVYPVADVVAMFGHQDARSTRSVMTSQNGYTMVKGWPVDEVEWVLRNRDPRMLVHWRNRRRREAEEK